MELGIKNKNALICASSGGIGYGIAESLAMEGANVCILGRDQERLSKAQKKIENVSSSKVVASKCDLASAKDLNDIYKFATEHLGSIDILINNTGGPKPGAFESITSEEVNASFDACLFPILNMTRLCIPEMKAKKWGRIINILSLSAKEPIPNMFLSNLIRPALLGFSKTVAQENAAHGITVNSLLPAAVLSDRTNFFINQAAEKNQTSFTEELKKIEETLPNKSMMTPEEFAQTATFLCSKNASHVNGTVLTIDAGISKGLY